MRALSDFLDMMVSERMRQDELWKDQELQKNPFVMSTVLQEEVGEVARAILEGKSEDLYTELVHVAAVCAKIYQNVNL